MLSQEIVYILLKYHNEVAEEISNINLAIGNIVVQLNSVSSVLIDELLSYAKNTGIDHTDKELELLQDSQKLRQYISSIQEIIPDYNYDSEELSAIELQLGIHDVIVLSNTLKCSYSNHKTTDVIIQVPVLYNDENVVQIPITASYCQEYNRYTILKDDFKAITGIIVCKVIDETISASSTNDDEIDIEQKQSILYSYGYNVQSKTNLSDRQRHMILASVIEAEILNRRQVADHLTTLIERGSKIPKWKDATEKWKQDKRYVEKYKTENLPTVIFDKIILKYRKSK